MMASRVCECGSRLLYPCLLFALSLVIRVGVRR